MHMQNYLIAVAYTVCMNYAHHQAMQFKSKVDEADKCIYKQAELFGL